MATVMHDLDSRFLVNLPDEELSSFERIMFQLQQAHWYYLDFYSDRYPAQLPSLGFKNFCTLYFQHIPTFRKHLSRFDQVYASFNAYLNAVPVCGCILVSPDMQSVLMVQGWAAQSWGFPRGKLDQHEDEITCAIREVEEEVGFDARAWFKGYDIKPAAAEAGTGKLSRQISSASNTSSSALASLQPSFLEAHTQNKATRLYVLLNVPRDTKFQTRTRKEIGQIEWIPISALPGGNAKNNNANSKSAPAPPQPTGNPAVDAANMAAFQSQHGGGAAAAAPAGRLKFGNAVTVFAGKLRTFLKKVKNGQITGYGIYEPPRENNAQQQQAVQQSGKKQPPTQPKSESKSARKAAAAQQQQQQQPQAAAGSSSARRGSASNSAKSLAFGADGNNNATFGNNGASSAAASTAGNGGGGWSVEQMFAANARLGVVSTVQEEKLQLSPQLDAQLDKFLGRKPQNGQQQQQQQQQPKGKKKQKAAAAAIADGSVPNASVSSGPMSIPGANHSKAPALPVDELDFGHNPHLSYGRPVTYSNMDPQPVSLVASSAPSPPKQTQLAKQADQQQAQNDAAAAQAQGGQKPGRKRGNKQAAVGISAPAAASAASSSPAQFRIVPRGTASAASGLPLLPSSSATDATAAPSGAPAAAAAADFKFDMNSISAALL
jgi:8-oxo-dGTP pyrophosphatase MutT (NUDIX family)